MMYINCQVLNKNSNTQSKLYFWLQTFFIIIILIDQNSKISSNWRKFPQPMVAVIKTLAFNIPFFGESVGLTRTIVNWELTFYYSIFGTVAHISPTSYMGKNSSVARRQHWHFWDTDRRYAPQKVVDRMLNLKKLSVV